MSADDTSTLNIGDNFLDASSAASHALTMMSKWCRSNNLLLNENETCFLHFHNKINPPTVRAASSDLAVAEFLLDTLSVGDVAAIVAELRYIGPLKSVVRSRPCCSLQIIWPPDFVC
jgi:hypothetical protein